MKLKYLPIILTQILIWVLGRILFFIKFNISYNYSSIKFEKNKTYIFTSNHPTKYDPFLIGVYLPFSQLHKILPLRFITTEDYMKKIHYKFFLMLFGCISTKKEKSISVLNKATELLEENNTIVMFPTGKLERNDIHKKPKVGAIYLHRDVKNSQLVLFSIKVNEKKTLRKKLFLEFIGFEKINLFSEDLQPIANKVFKKLK